MALKSDPPEPSVRAPMSSALDEEETSLLLERFGRHVPAGEVIFEEGAPANSAYLLREGSVRLFRRMHGGERGIGLVKPGDIFGESSLMPDTFRGSMAMSVVPSVIVELDRRTFRGLCSAHPDLCMRLLEQMILRVQDTEDQLEIASLRDPQYRVVTALVKLGRTGSGEIELAVSPVELATRVGLDVEAVKRHVQVLLDQGYLSIAGERIKILNLEAFRRLWTLLGTKEELQR